MQTHLVLTAIGPDRPGLVSALSDTITSGGGNWLDARMASLAGQFAGILLVGVDEARADALEAALRRLDGADLRLTIARSSGEPDRARVGRMLRLELVGHDRPGIVRDVSRVLAQQQVSIAEFESERSSGSFSGETLFKARARLQLPPGMGPEAVRRGLEALANELMVDLSPDDGSAL
jgi:glycine cleavage system regulatory protein